jgi:hypothetical protein
LHFLELKKINHTIPTLSSKATPTQIKANAADKVEITTNPPPY